MLQAIPDFGWTIKIVKKEMSPEPMAQTIYDKLKHKLDWAIGLAKSTVNT